MEPYRGIKFNSHDSYFKSPSGAIPTDGTATLRVLVPHVLDAYGVTLRLWEDGREKLLNMTQKHTFASTPYGDFLDEYTINVSRETSGLIWYQFTVNTPVRPYYLCAPSDGLGGECEIHLHPHTDRSFLLTVYDKDFSVPPWAQGSVMYQIFPDRFYRNPDFGDTGNRKMHGSFSEMPDWQIDEEKGYYPADDFFGGNLKGIENKLGYLKSLGVDVIYLNPIFRAYSNHRYDTGDYEEIDPLLGTNEDFISLCTEAKRNGIRIILDGVFSHTGSNSKYFNRENVYPTVGAYQSDDSPYRKWYKFEKFPDKYDCWWGVWSLPCVDENEPSYRNYILNSDDGIAVQWLNRGASGWRLDVADELPDSFIGDLRKTVKSKDRDALIIGEVWEDASTKISYGKQREFLFGSELDTVMNYPLRNATVKLLREEMSTEDFCRTMLSLREHYPEATFNCLMNFVSTHDVERIITALAADTSKLSREEQANFTVDRNTLLQATESAKLAALIIFSLPGMPCIYYGDEAGLTGCKDPFNRKPFPWGNENVELTEWYKKLAEIHDCPCFKYGSLFLDSAGSLISIRRKHGDGMRYVLINVSDSTVETMLDVTYFSKTPQLLLDNGGGVQFGERENGYYLLLPPKGGAVFGT